LTEKNLLIVDIFLYKSVTIACPVQSKSVNSGNRTRCCVRIFTRNCFIVTRHYVTHLSVFLLVFILAGRTKPSVDHDWTYHMCKLRSSILRGGPKK